MNKFIKKELEKCTITKNLKFNDDKTIIEIKRPIEDILSEDLSINYCYIIELADYILKPPPGFTLATNWNKGITPTSKYIKCMVTQIMGKMILIDGCGYNISNNVDLSDTYLGLWLPRQAIKIIQKVE